MSFFLRTLLAAFVICSVSASRGDYRAVIEPAARTSWGRWGPIAWCPYKTFAYGMTLKVEGRQGGGDDTSVNAVALYCSKNRGYVTSSQGRWGRWESNKVCRNSVITGVAIKSEKSQGLGDDTAANNFVFYCRNRQRLFGRGNAWGTWSRWALCPRGTAICGIQTMVEGPQGRKDDTALNRARFFCCRG